MSDAAGPTGRGLPGGAPGWLRRPAARLAAGGRLGLLEASVLVLAGLLLATATVNDLVRQTHVNHRLTADLRTWRAYTRHDYRNLNINQDVRGQSTRDVVCGNTAPGAPKARVQLCLQMMGPVRSGRRSVSGGWYLPPRVENVRRYRYACFGPAAAEHRCPP